MVFQKDRKICPVADSSAIVLPPLNKKHGVEERLPQSLFEASPGTSSEKKLSLLCATYNVFTLGKQAGNFVGYLRDQVQAHGIDVLFLQETRSKKSSMVLSQTHIRIVSEAVHGKGGTEIWLLRATTSNRGKGFVPEQVQVLLADAEMLILKAAYRSIDFLLGSMHAPHSGHDSSTIQAYWKGLGRQLKPYLSKYNNFVFGTDANAHFAAPCDGCIGDVGLETRNNIGGEAMKDFLMEIQGFLPSTYEHIHEGQDFTWQSSANGSVSRCDYLILPCNWTHANIKSWVLHTLDTAKDAIDHWPLAVQIKLVWNLPQPKSSRPAFCRQKLAMATGDELNALLSHVEVPKWEEDIDTHVTKLSGQIHGLLCDHFPKSKQQPRKSFISQATWELRRSRIRARRCTQGLKARIDLCSLRAFFLAWFHDCRPQREGLFAELFGHIKQVLCSKAHTAALTVKLTKQLKQDRVRALETLAKDTLHAGQRETMQMFRSIGVLNRKKPTGIKPLPLLLSPDGRPLETVSEIAKHWRDYFSEQEDGKVTTFHDLLATADAQALETVPLPTWHDLPSRYQIEEQFHRTSAGKAFFADGIPGDLLKKMPAKMAEVFYTLYLKEVIYLREPLLHKGGYLVAAFKKGDARLMSNYRSLFVSSVNRRDCICKLEAFRSRVSRSRFMSYICSNKLHNRRKPPRPSSSLMFRMPFIGWSESTLSVMVLPNGPLWNFSGL